MRGFRTHVLPVIAWLVYSLWSRSWRVRLIEPPELVEDLSLKNPVIMAHWHGDELSLFHLVKRYKLATMTSTSKDGQIVDFVIRRYGGATSRGSSTRGAIQALKGLIRLIKSGRPASMAVDGPKGPIYMVKPGVFELSRLSHAKIYPVGVCAPKSIGFSKSWNKTFLPKPFSRVCIFFDRPFPVVDKSLDPKSPDLALQLKEAIDNAKRHAAKQIAPHDAKC